MPHGILLHHFFDLWPHIYQQLGLGGSIGVDAIGLKPFEWIRIVTHTLEEKGNQMRLCLLCTLSVDTFKLLGIVCALVRRHLNAQQQDFRTIGFGCLGHGDQIVLCLRQSQATQSVIRAQLNDHKFWLVLLEQRIHP